MSMFLKDSVVVQAFELTWENWNALADWCNADLGMRSTGGLVINTTEGPITVDVGDWIIKDAKGEFYPCKPDIFVGTYKPLKLPEKA